MNRYLLTLTALSLACTAQRRDETDSVVTSWETATSPCPAATAPLQPSTMTTPSLSGVSTSADPPGYLVATEYLLALFDCAQGLNCDENAKRVLNTAQSFTVELPHVKNSSPCRTIHGLLENSWCGMFNSRALSTFREAITGAADCLTSTPESRATCISQPNGNFWIGSHTCSKEVIGELKDLKGPKSEFKANEPWVVQVWGLDAIGWSACIEGYGEEVTGLNVTAILPGE